MLLGFQLNEKKDIESISNMKYIKPILALQFLITALFPAIFGYIGFTYFGWSLPSGKIIMVSSQFSILIGIGTFLAYLFCIFALANVLYAMRNVYGADMSAEKAFVFSYYCSIPFLMASITLLHPHLVINFIALIAAIIYSTQILYTKLYKVANIEAERGFLYSSTALTAMLIAFVVCFVTGVIVYINFGYQFHIN